MRRVMFSIGLSFILSGDLYEEDQILNWLMTQKDPGGDVIEDLEGQRLIDLIEESGSMAVYFCKCTLSNVSNSNRFCSFYLKSAVRNMQ